MTTAVDFVQLNSCLSVWLRRLRLRDALLWSLRGLNAGLAVALGLALMARLRPLWPVSTLMWVSACLALAGLAGAFIMAYFWPRSSLAAARYFDGLLGLAERTSTAIELARGDGGAPSWLVAAQLTDAVTAARRADYRRHLPFRIERVDGLLPAGLMLGLGLALYLPNPQQNILAEQLAVKQTVAEQIQVIETAIEAIEKNSSLTDEQKDDLIAPLADAERKLKEGELTREQALQVLEAARQELQALADPETLAAADALRQAGDSLMNEPVTQAVGQALAQGDFQAAAEALANMDLTQMTDAQLDALADRLADAARQLQSSNPELAAELQAAADALRQGDLDNARAALQRAAQKMQTTAKAVAHAQAAAAAAAQMAKSGQTVAQAGTGRTSGENAGRQGDGSTRNPGGGGGGGGAGRGEGNDAAQGGEAGSNPIEGNNGPGDAGERDYEAIYSPYRLGGSGGDDVYLPHSDETGGDVVGEGPVGFPETGDVYVPYYQLLPAYRDAAYSAINSGEVPPGLEEVVRDYFSSLEP